MEKNYVPLKINYDVNEKDFEEINKKYGPIRGFPTYLIISKEDEILKRMGAELGELAIAKIIELLEENLK